MYTLCVIDMQDYFRVKPNTRVANNCEREIRQAIKDNAAIILVEYEGCGETIQQLTDAAKDAYKLFRITKRSDDGAREIVREIQRNDLSTHIKVCGVNTDCCVYRTLSGLRNTWQHTNIDLIADACDSDWSPNSHDKGVENIRKLGCRIINYEPEAPWNQITSLEETLH